MDVRRTAAAAATLMVLLAGAAGCGADDPCACQYPDDDASPGQKGNDREPRS